MLYNVQADFKATKTMMLPLFSATMKQPLLISKKLCCTKIQAGYASLFRVFFQPELPSEAELVILGKTFKILFRKKKKINDKKYRQIHIK